jgi:hypothetical protein
VVKGRPQTDRSAPFNPYSAETGDVAVGRVDEGSNEIGGFVAAA